MEDKVSSYDVVVKQVDPQVVASIRTTLPKYNEVGSLFGELFQALGPNAGQVGVGIAIWHDPGLKESDVDAEAALTLLGSVPESRRMRVYELPGATMASTVHRGPYQTLGDAHDAVMKWSEAHGYRIAGPIREVYLHLTMPARQDDPSDITEIQHPVEKV
jgi:effector-binding domain-containing protein